MERTGGSVLLAGGGTGGHIYPNLALAERLDDLAPGIGVHLLVSDRSSSDTDIVSSAGRTSTAIPARPLPRRPREVLPFLRSWRRSLQQVRQLIAARDIRAVVATGGFVSGPAIVAARRAGVPSALVNLDAVPGVANRYLARFADAVFTTYPSPRLTGARRIGLPLRAAATSPLTPSDARSRLDLDPALPLLFITGATHGGGSLIAALQRVVTLPAAAEPFSGWQILHQCGSHDPTPIQAAYDDAGVPATVVGFLTEIGVAWRAAELAVARAGAGTVAEAWANATPTVFVPNPHHPDQRLGLNARPLADAGGARIVDEASDPGVTATVLLGALDDLLRDADERDTMRAALERTRPTAGADAVVDWIRRHHR